MGLPNAIFMGRRADSQIRTFTRLRGARRTRHRGVHLVVELFLLGDDERYLELEFGPHGHHLALALRGSRHVEVSGLPLDFSASRTDRRWRGRARLAGALLPTRLRAFNAHAIHGQGASRRCLSAHPLTGDEPDFHQLRSFALLRWPERPAILSGGSQPTGQRSLAPYGAATGFRR